MYISRLKITGILSIAILVLISSCEREYDYSLIFDESYPEQLKKEVCYCGKEPDKEVSFKEYSFNIKGELILVIQNMYGSNQSKTQSFYNQSGGKSTDSIFYYSEGAWIIDQVYKYSYNKDLLLEKIRKNQMGEETHKTLYTYRGTMPEWEEFYYFKDNEWDFQYAHKFEFNRNGLLVKKSSYTTTEKDKVYDYFTYSYKNGKLSEEERILQTGKVSYHKDYFYNKDGMLDYVVQDGNIIEKNTFENSRLVEKQTWYYGIDPCFSQCCGNFICKYEY
jgi:hypothetical protein